MKILVTGANGQLGRSLQKIGGEYPQYTLLFTDLPEGDITDKAAMIRQVRENGIGLIVNCAAYTAVEQAEEEPDNAWRANALGPAVLAEVAREEGVKLIHLSTDYVFDGNARAPYTEDDPPHPQSVYGSTKLAGEQAIRESGCDAVILRTAWLYSEFGHNFVRTMLRQGREREVLNVVYDQKGTPTYATDLARAILQLAGRKFSGAEIFHYSNAGETTWFHFAQLIFDLSGIAVLLVPVTSDAYPHRAPRPTYSVLSKERIQALGVEVPAWDESLKACINELNRTAHE